MYIITMIEYVHSLVKKDKTPSVAASMHKISPLNKF